MNEEENELIVLSIHREWKKRRAMASVYCVQSVRPYAKSCIYLTFIADSEQTHLFYISRTNTQRWLRCLLITSQPGKAAHGFQLQLAFTPVCIFSTLTYYMWHALGRKVQRKKNSPHEAQCKLQWGNLFETVWVKRKQLSGVALWFPCHLVADWNVFVAGLNTIWLWLAFLSVERN